MQHSLGLAQAFMPQATRGEHTASSLCSRGVPLHTQARLLPRRPGDQELKRRCRAAGWQALLKAHSFSACWDMFWPLLQGLLGCTCLIFYNTKLETGAVPAMPVQPNKATHTHYTMPNNPPGNQVVACPGRAHKNLPTPTTPATSPSPPPSVPLPAGAAAAAAAGPDRSCAVSPQPS